MDDLELQDEPLQLRLMDHDTYSSNDAIGKVYLDLNPLLCNSSRGKGKLMNKRHYKTLDSHHSLQFFIFRILWKDDIRMDSSVRHHAWDSWGSKLNC